MDLKKLSVEELRQYCLKNNLNFLETLTSSLDSSVESETLAKPPKQKKVSKPSRRRAYRPLKKLVISTLDDVRNSENSKRPSFSLEDFVVYVESDMQNREMTLEEKGPLMGAVCDILYDYAEVVKFGKGNGKVWNQKIKEPVLREDLGNLLGVDFGESGFAQIAGILAPEYVLNTYPELGNESGGKYNVEGTSSWPGEEKARIRSKLVDMVSAHIVKPIEKEREEEIIRLRGEKEALQKDTPNAGVEKEQLVYQIIGEDPGVMITFRNRFLKGTIQGATDNQYDLSEGMNITNHNNTSTTVEFKNKKTKEEFLKRWQHFSGTKRHNRYTKAIEIKEVENLETKNLRERKKRIREKSREYQERIGELESERSELNYLGLEGANFTSYLQLAKTLEEQGVDLKGIAPEYKHRLANIMKSVVDSGINKSLENMTVVQEDIDNLVLLDFVKDENVKLKRDKTGFSVEFEGDEIKLPKYNELLRDIDKGISTRHLSVEYSLSESFIQAVSDRYEGKFDVVFLDYVGPTSSKRKQVLETLASRRLNDRAIVATTFNMAKWKLHPVPADEVPEKVFDDGFEVFENQGYSVIDGKVPYEYKDGTEAMCFASFVLNKEK